MRCTICSDTTKNLFLLLFLLKNRMTFFSLITYFFPQFFAHFLISDALLNDSKEIAAGDSTITFLAQRCSCACQSP